MATLKHGARTIPVIGLTLVRGVLAAVGSNLNRAISIQYSGAPMKQNELLGEQMLKSIQDTERRVTAHGIAMHSLTLLAPADGNAAPGKYCKLLN